MVGPWRTGPQMHLVHKVMYIYHLVNRMRLGG